MILVHKGVWYGKFLVLIEACLISYLRGSFSIFSQVYATGDGSFDRQKPPWKCDSSPKMRAELKLRQHKNSSSSPLLLLLCYACYLYPFHLPSKKVKKDLWRATWNAQKLMLKHCNTVCKKCAIPMIGCKEANFQVEDTLD